MTKTKKPVEIRYEDGELDEVCLEKPDFVHFEVMSRGAIWCGITMKNGERLDLWFTSKNGRSHIQYSVADNGVLPKRCKITKDGKEVQ
jgi:hypothetical protein